MGMNSRGWGSTLAGSLVPGAAAFVIVDPLVGEPLPVEQVGDGMPALTRAREQAWMRPVQVIELAQNIALPPSLYPYLVALEGADDPWLAETAEIANAEWNDALAEGLAGSGAAPHRIGGWLQTSLAAGDLAQSLGAMMKVNTEAHTQARYMRLADRRALGWLRHVVGDERLAAQFGRIQSWHYLDACGQLAQLCSTAEVAQPLRLTRAEWATFMKGEWLHATVARWLGERAHRVALGEARPPPASSCYLQAGAALERAEAAARRWPQRFAKPADSSAWAALTLLHPGVEQDAKVLALLDAAPEAGEPLETLDTLGPALSALREKATP